MVLTLIGYAVLALTGLGLFLWAVGVFNDLVGLKNKVRQDFSNVEVALRQRHDEIPQLVELCRAYMKHESDVLERVTRLRSSYRNAADINAKVHTENLIHALFLGFPAIVEAYPDLKANEQFRRLQVRLTAIETSIADRRELYNQSATYYNTALGQFPQLFLVKLLRVKPQALFELADPEEACSPEVRLSESAT